MHGHDHGHHHDHGGGQSSYFIDQLCTIAVAGAYAGVAISMFFTKARGDDERTLLNIIAPWIQWTLLGGSFVLLLLSMLRAIGVWQASGRLATHTHEHDHDHDCCGDDHAHAHGHHHHDHDHGWSPLRYIPLVIPLVLYLGMGLPDSRMIQAYEQAIINNGLKDDSGTATPVGTLNDGAASVLMVGMLQLNAIDIGGLQLGLQCQAQSVVGPVADDIEEKATADPDARIDLGELEAVAMSAEQRAFWKTKYKRVEVEGMFSPVTEDGRIFRIVRLRMNCCLADARPAMMIGASRRPNNFPRNQWVAVQGRLDFVQADGKWQPVMRVYSIKVKKLPAKPYLT